MQFINQPQTPGPIDPYWLARGLVFISLGNGLFWTKATGWSGHFGFTGAPKTQFNRFGRSNGFGSTYGGGTTDRITGPTVTLSSGIRSLVEWHYANGNGGGGIGRVFQSNGDSANLREAGYINSVTAGRFIYARGNATTGGIWDLSDGTAPLLSQWVCYGVTHDQTASGNTPVMYENGVAGTVTVKSTPVGALTTGTYTLDLGNRSTDNARNFDGILGPMVIFDHPSQGLTATEHASLYANIWQVMSRPVKRSLIGFAASGSTGTSSTTNNNDTSAASGTTTVLGTLAKTNANDTSAASGTTTVTGTLAKTNANDTSAAAGTTTVLGTLAKTNANDSVSASGSAGANSGTVNYTNANDTVSASGWAGTITGTVNVTNANDTSDASGAVLSNGVGGGKAKKKLQRQILKLNKQIIQDLQQEVVAQKPATKAVVAQKAAILDDDEEELLLMLL